VPLLRVRNLLIPRTGRNGRSGQNASLRYTAGTRPQLRFPVVDSNQRPLGYEINPLRLSESFCGTHSKPEED
jgi:hypothetical protein